MENVTAETIEQMGEKQAERRMWAGGALSGLVGGVGMGLVIQFGAGTMALIGALYGQPTVLAGWVAHLVHSVVFAVVFVALVSNSLLDDYTTTAGELVGLGVAYGAALAVLTGGFLLPLGLNAVGARELPVPLLPIPGLVGEFTFPLVFALGHLVYGALLGGVYAAVAHVEWSAGADEERPGA